MTKTQSMAPNLAYEYAALPRRSIRLLRLRAGSPDSPLICSLRDESLDAPDIQYKALSYCWGDDRPQSRLLVEGEANETSYLPIRPNLAAALHQLRTNTLACCDLSCPCDADGNCTHPAEDSRFTSPVALWIDAVCINQSDLDERSRQVALMHEIYTKATVVIAWFGPLDEYTIHALRMVHGFARLGELPRCATRSGDKVEEGKRGSVKLTTVRRHVAINPNFTPSWIALGHFFADNHWWERMWIVQEIVLARRVIMVAGPFGTTWARFVQASEAFHQDSFYEQLCEATLPTGEFAHIWPVIAGFLRVQGLERVRSFVTDSNTVAMRNSDMAVAQKLSVMHLLGWAFRYKATNPRDKVYGIFGILKALRATLHIQPRYEGPVCEVYMQTAKLIYDQTGDLSFIEAVENNRVVNHVRRFGLPSWTPDFAAPNNLLPISWARLADTASLYRESWAPHWSGGEKSRCVFDFTAKAITVQGFRIDTIQILSEPVHDEISGTGTTTAKLADPLPVYHKRLDSVPSEDEDAEETERSWHSVLGAALENSQAWVPTQDGIAANDDRGPGHRHFQTGRHGFIGFTQVAACVGDEICWLIGLGFPCILRREGRAWKFVGLW
ncbi:heterokaryon incompatibility protein-domain-containing protein [Immersiella caudata]|uniref:Heterokaryon incompatibility protein-domain-containing protein n=1 Tax=Immersiella caudata TaxID=314043 RepID=A0AA39WZ70_9PEZI|nr:heterokaryon incompatibility protein-domain-containing protein [Immersiella caudata]